VTSATITILVAVAAGLGGTLVKVSHDRAAELRSRMLDAADEFSTRVVTALHAARNSSGEILDLGKDDLVDPELEWDVVVKDAFTHVGEAVDDAQARSARVHLLFGQDSLPGIAATEIITRLRNVELAMVTGRTRCMNGSPCASTGTTTTAQ
jgi:hypothetical protein